MPELVYVTGLAGTPFVKGLGPTASLKLLSNSHSSRRPFLMSEVTVTDVVVLDPKLSVALAAMVKAPGYAVQVVV